MTVSSRWFGRRNVSLCEDGGIPVTGSSLIFSCAIVHEGVMRLSDEDAGEVTSSGMSLVVSKAGDILAPLGGGWEAKSSSRSVGS